MARSLLSSFVTGTRQVLGIQLFVSLGAVALAGWTLAVTNDVIRERDRLRERVIQLEQSMAGRGITVPATAPVVETPPPNQLPADAYPPSAPNDAPEDQQPGAPEDDATRPPDSVAERQPFNPGQVIGDLFAPAPPLRTVVLHVRDRADYEIARRIAARLAEANQARVTVDVMGPGDKRQSGYAYFDGRQSRSAAAFVSQFNDTARRLEIAPWSAQLRGVALPAQGEYTADRLDIVLPPRSAPTPSELLRVTPQNVRPPG